MSVRDQHGADNDRTDAYLRLAQASSQVVPTSE
jgi:hypothetical protein